MYWFCAAESFLAFVIVVPFLSRDFRGSVGTKNPCFLLVVFLAFSPETQKQAQGLGLGFGP